MLQCLDLTGLTHEQQRSKLMLEVFTCYSVKALQQHHRPHQAFLKSIATIAGGANKLAAGPATYTMLSSDHAPRM